MNAGILTILCCCSCGITKQHTTTDKEYSSSLLKMDSSFSHTSLTSVGDLMHHGELAAHINIRTFSLPDSLGIQYLLSETNIDLSMNDETKGHQETAEDSTSGSRSINVEDESRS
jgi:hypothetical protein